jgi:CRP-like cAMP-binding protein
MRGWTPGTLLHGLDPADRQALLGMGTRRAFPAGATLISEGSPDTDAFVLLDGYVKVLCDTPDGRAVLVSIRIGGDVVGELAALDHEPRSASVVALTAVTARALPRDAFLRFIDERPRAAAAIRRAVVAELRRATRHRVVVGRAPVGVRLALVLDHLAEAYGRPCAEGVRIEVPLSQPELASLIGVSEPSLHRALSELRSREVVATRYRRLIVRDLAGLRAYAGG